MCGIAGFVDFAGHEATASAQRVRRMTDAIVYRGPDESGHFVDGHVALGHRRLAIIDLASGQQPMATPDGRLRIVFNGEIYNFPALRSELAGLGYVFQTHSDTEVILHAYAAWGQACVGKFNGMFAFAIWDAPARTLFLARDRVGKKPLYVSRRGTRLAFASEIKALRAGGWCDSAIDPVSLDCYFTLGYIPTPRTIYRDVQKLPPATTLTVTSTGETLQRYWDNDFSPVAPASEGAMLDELEALLDDAVRCRMMSEVPLGAFLSGGVDSSLVVASMARQSSKPVITHTIGFEQAADSEAPIARQIAAHLGTDHREYTVVPRATDVLARIARHFDEPLADSSALPTWYVCEMTRRSVIVVLSGDGGDEGFAGYTFRYRPHVLESALRKRLPAALRSSALRAAAAVWPGSARLPQPLRLKTILGNLAVSDVEAFYRDLAWLRPDDREQLYAAGFKSQLKGFTPMEIVAPWYGSSQAHDPLSRSQYTDQHLYMTDDVLVKVDRLSMAHSIEVRSPLLDYRLLEFGARLPADWRLRGGQGKWPLRELCARRLPAAIRDLPKRGFSIPAARWLRGELKPMAHDILFTSGNLASQVLDPSQVQRLWAEHQSGARDHNVFLWGLMMLGLWEQECRRDVP